MRIDKIKQIAINAENLDESVEFYEIILGAKLVARYDPPGLAFFDFDGTRLLVEKGGGIATIYFWVDDIIQGCQELEAKGITFDQPAQVIFQDEEGVFGNKGEAEWMAFFKDPAGNTLALASTT